MDIRKFAKHLGVRHNVAIRVIDPATNQIVSHHEGHNAATNSLLTGIGHYLTGDGILNQGYDMLSAYVPKYISLGTMGLINQDEDDNGYPAGIGIVSGTEEERFIDYMQQCPGYGADGYDANLNNGRKHLGLGPMFADRASTKTYETLQMGDLNFDGKVDADDVMILVDYNCGVRELTDKQKAVADINRDGKIDCIDMQLLRRCAEGEISQSKLGVISYSSDSAPAVDCELISTSFPRASISFRDIVPEYESELPKTIDVVFSAMISTGALAQFREPGRDYIFITEAGLWSRPDWVDGGDNGLLAGYRIAPPNEENWDMTVAANRDLLKKQIIRVGINQVVQVIWKIQLGGIDQLRRSNNHCDCTCPSPDCPCHGIRPATFNSYSSVHEAEITEHAQIDVEPNS